MDFPYRYHVNGKIVFDGGEFDEWFLSILKNNDGDGIYKKSIEIIEKYNLYEFFQPFTIKEK